MAIIGDATLPACDPQRTQLANERNVVKERLLACCVAIGSAFACGGGGSDEGSSLNLPSEQVFCALTIGTSSREDALRTLGPATASSGSGDLSTLEYHYGDFARATSVSDIAALELDFDKDEIFQNATVVNIPFPQCWEDEQARKRALTGN